MKRYICLLLVLLLICVQANAFAAGDDPWLPDPEGIFAVAGECFGDYEYNGAQYTGYSYEFYMSSKELARAMVSYQSCLEENYGYVTQRYEFEGTMDYIALFHPKCERAAEIAIYLEDTGNILNGGMGLLVAVLAVPEGFHFVPGSYPDFEVRQCGLCGGSGKCGNCVRGKSNYGAGFVDCVICDGNDICRLCGGTGLRE